MSNMEAPNFCVNCGHNVPGHTVWCIEHPRPENDLEYIVELEKGLLILEQSLKKPKSDDFINDIKVGIQKTREKLSELKKSTSTSLPAEDGASSIGDSEEESIKNFFGGKDVDSQEVSEGGLEGVKAGGFAVPEEPVEESPESEIKDGESNLKDPFKRRYVGIDDSIPEKQEIVLPSNTEPKKNPRTLTGDLWANVEGGTDGAENNTQSEETEKEESLSNQEEGMKDFFKGCVVNAYNFATKTSSGEKKTLSAVFAETKNSTDKDKQAQVKHVNPFTKAVLTDFEKIYANDTISDVETKQKILDFIIRNIEEEFKEIGKKDPKAIKEIEKVLISIYRRKMLEVKNSKNIY